MYGDTIYPPILNLKSIILKARVFCKCFLNNDALGEANLQLCGRLILVVFRCQCLPL